MMASSWGLRGMDLVVSRLSLVVRYSSSLASLSLADIEKPATTEYTGFHRGNPKSSFAVRWSSSSQLLTNDQRRATDDRFATSNHLAPRLVPSLLLRNACACVPRLHRRRDPASPGLPGGARVRAAPGTCTLMLAARAWCAAFV